MTKTKTKTKAEAETKAEGHSRNAEHLAPLCILLRSARSVMPSEIDQGYFVDKDKDKDKDEGEDKGKGKGKGYWA